MFTRFLILLAAISQLQNTLQARTGGKEGHGGGSVQCTTANPPRKSTFLYDLYEGDKRYKMKIIRSNRPYQDQATDKLNALLAAEPNIFSSVPNYVYNLMNTFRSLERGSHLKEVNDVFPQIWTDNCAFKQLANFTEPADLLVDQVLFEDLESETDRAALFVHEAVYKIRRDLYRDKDSTNARKIIAALFSDLTESEFVDWYVKRDQPLANKSTPDLKMQQAFVSDVYFYNHSNGQAEIELARTDAKAQCDKWKAAIEPVLKPHAIYAVVSCPQAALLTSSSSPNLYLDVNLGEHLGRQAEVVGQIVMKPKNSSLKLIADPIVRGSAKRAKPQTFYSLGTAFGFPVAAYSAWKSSCEAFQKDVRSHLNTNFVAAFCGTTSRKNYEASESFQIPSRKDPGSTEQISPNAAHAVYSPGYILFVDQGAKEVITESSRLETSIAQQQLSSIDSPQYYPYFLSLEEKRVLACNTWRQEMARKYGSRLIYSACETSIYLRQDGNMQNGFLHHSARWHERGKNQMRSNHYVNILSSIGMVWLYRQ